MFIDTMRAVPPHDRFGRSSSGSSTAQTSDARFRWTTEAEALIHDTPLPQRAAAERVDSGHVWLTNKSSVPLERRFPS
jgi:hypothetical protein